jgi:hypothetical protein
MGAIGTHTLIQKITVGSAGAASIDFTSIPATYTDLCLKLSTRSAYTQIYDPIGLQINGDTTNTYYTRRLYGNGATAVSDVPSNPSSVAAIGFGAGASATASTFGNIEVYFPNAFGSTQKSFSHDAVNENNATTAYAVLAANLWTGTAAISSLKILSANGTSTFVQYSTASLYGIKTSSVPASPTPQAQGGDIIVNDGTYWYHAFISTGAFVPKRALTADVLVVAGGGGGNGGAGGGAGGYVQTLAQSFNSGTSHTTTVGAGGGIGTQGTNSNVTGGTLSLTAAVGGGGANGGSGGSGAGANNGGSPGAATSGQGFAGAAGGVGVGGGGGGAGAVGTSGGAGPGGNGGIGLNTWSTWLSTTGLGVSGYIAGGGGGTGTVHGTGGTGGGGTGDNTNGGAGTANTGGGGGGASTTPGVGGSGLIIIRYKL